MFEPLRPYGGAVMAMRGPSLDDLRRLLAAREPPIATRSGAQLSFVPQGRKAHAFEDKYEPRIYLKGEIPIRRDHWHDYFNALVWLTFPRSKAALNERHYRALLEQKAAGSQNRGPVQDTMTLFDEGGVIVAARDPELLRLIGDFAWKDLFWRNRARVLADMRFFLFGHALYEKALRPFAGITGRGVLFQVGTGFFASPLSIQLEHLDAMLAAYLLDAGRWRSTRELALLPILGVPGWCPDNAHASYYDNSDYFRTGRGR